MLRSCFLGEFISNRFGAFGVWQADKIDPNMALTYCGKGLVHMDCFLWI